MESRKRPRTDMADIPRPLKLRKLIEDADALLLGDDDVGFKLARSTKRKKTLGPGGVLLDQICRPSASQYTTPLSQTSCPTINEIGDFDLMMIFEQLSLKELLSIERGKSKGVKALDCR